MSAIYLYGAPASGKTTLGAKLAARLGRPFVDLDALIVEREGRDIPSIFAGVGEAGFRARESAALRAVEERDAVVALGGGTLLDESNRRYCESRGIVACLDAPSEEELARRIGSAAGSRPLGNRAKERAPHYASFARRIARTFELGPSLVVVGEGIAPAFADGLPTVADGNVAGIYGLRETCGKLLAVIPSGEANKTPATVMGLWSAFARGGLGRKDAVVAVGGGVTGDLTGFAAATWMRGMDWINVPTTLLAMVDASTGGKTGCDLPEGKNLAGAFHAPKLVVIDVDYLKTLPPEVLAAGRAEMIKHEVISGIARKPCGAAPTAREIADNLAVKIGIVERAPFERKGDRMLLNCGHTVAHAVETLTGYGVSHGEAVAIGCVAEARMAVERGIAAKDWPEELAARFAEAGLRTEMPGGLPEEAMRAAMKGDKKRKGDIVTFALPCGWGDVRLVPVDLSESTKK